MSSSEAIAGFLGAWVVLYVLVGAYSVAAYLRQPREPEYLAFGLLAFALAVFSGGCAAAYVSTDPAAIQGALTVAETGRIAAAAALLRLALEYAELGWRRRVLPVLYGIAAGFAIANLAGLLHRVTPAPGTVGHVLGVAVRDVALHRTTGAIAIAWVTTAAVLAAALLLARALSRGRTEGLGSVLGVACLTGATVYDALSTPCWTAGLVLTPYGYSAFFLGATATLVWRYAALRRQLENRTTELQELAQQLQQRSRELSAKMDELRAAQDDLVRKQQLAAIGELSAVVAHEVRNPLAIITTAVASLRKGKLGSDDRDTLLGILDEETERLNNLVGDLLVYARPMSVERQHVPLREIVERALAHAGSRSDLGVELREPDPVGKIWGDPNLLRQAFDNLVTNAVQAISGSGMLEVTLLRTDVDGAEGVELQIEDTGEGMDTSVRSRALDPFFTTRPRGTGLGLAIVARIIDAHGGRIRIESAAGAGTVVHVYLPRGAEGPVSRRVTSPDVTLEPRSSPGAAAQLRARRG